MSRITTTTYQDSPRILVIDDEQRIREACKMVLREMHFEVDLAIDGTTGLAQLEETHYDVVLVDLMMPGISGFDVLSKVQDLHPDTSIIVITGYATVEHSIEAMKKGAFDFIPKPFTPEQLRTIVTKSIKYTRALQDIRDSKSRIGLMVNRLMDGVMTTDSEGRIVLANPAFLHMTALHGQDIIGKKVGEVIDCSPLRQLISQTLSMPPETFTELTEEVQLQGSNSTEQLIFSARCTPFKGKASTKLGTITVLNDITAMKKMDQMKSDFVSMVSHEIRSPMNSLLAQMKILLDGLAGDLTDKQREIIGRASGKIDSLNSLVTELLDLARIESGMMTAEKEDINMQELLQSQIAFHGAGAGEKDISISLNCTTRLPPVLANQQSMEEVCTNLITNSIKYSPHGSHITVTAGVANDYFRLQVSDTGFGIPQEDLDKIFTRFHRVKDANTRTIHGTGLGLAIVKSIIESHHGTINVTSTLGQGTTFTMLLPLGPES